MFLSTRKNSSSDQIRIKKENYMLYLPNIHNIFQNLSTFLNKKKSSNAIRLSMPIFWQNFVKQPSIYIYDPRKKLIDKNYWIISPQNTVFL